MLSMGIVFGLFVALALGRLVRDFLVGVAPTDPLTYVSVSIVLIGTALAACYAPARRAIRIDPLAALRHD